MGSCRTFCVVRKDWSFLQSCSLKHISKMDVELEPASLPWALLSLEELLYPQGSWPERAVERPSNCKLNCVGGW